MNRFGTLLIISITLFSCQSGQQEPGANQQKQEQAATQQTADEKLYPSLPLDTLQMLWKQCDYIDYVFYYKDFSVSQNKSADIQGAVRYISEEVPVIQPNCQPIGRIFFQVQGENRLEADLHFSQGCTYFIFYENGKKTYANSIMPAGVQFFNQILSTGTEAPASH